MALGVLLILSASFLAVQLWSEKVYRGAAEALEAPVMPPAMPTARKGKSGAALDKKIEKAKTVAAVEVVKAPEVQNTEEASVSETETDSEKTRPVAQKPAKMPDMIEAPAMPPAADVREKPAKSAKPAKAAEPVVESSEPAVPVTPVVAEPLTEVKEPKTVEPAVKADPAPVVRVVKTVVAPVKAAEEPRKPSVKRKKAVKVEDESEIPQEWNWFNAPLKIEFSDGRVEIVSAEARSEVKMVGNIQPEPVVEEPSANHLEESRQVEPSFEKPFVAALARMGRLRSMRTAAVVKDPGLEKAILARRSESLEHLRDAVVKLCNKLDPVEAPRADAGLAVGSGDSTTGLESVSSVTAQEGFSSEDKSSVAETEKNHQVTADDHQFVPYYAGSGSDLSSRINDLITKGFGSRRK